MQIELSIIISLFTGISGVLVAWLGFARSAKKEIANQASNDAVLKESISHIKSGVDAIKQDQKTYLTKVDLMAEKLTRVEMISEEAHRRIDRMERRTGPV